MSSQKEIGSLVKELENNYISGTTKKSKYVEYSLYNTIETIYAYLNSKHTSGLYDSQGREKPFFNITTAVVNIWYRATDIDRKNIRIKAVKKQDELRVMVATALLQDYMRREAFGVFLNDWGRVSAAFNSAVLKFVEKDGRLISSVVPWSRLIVDAVNFEDNPVIEKLELTPAQLRANSSYNQDVVEELIDAVKSRKTIGRENKDNLNNYIEVYEVHGELPLSYLTGKEEDEKTYVQQMHIISCVNKKGRVKKGESKYDTFTLYSGREKNPYMITHLLKEEDRTLGIGAVEHLFDAQWMVNHTAKAIKDQLDQASKIIYQTADQNFLGKNALNEIENGDILIYSQNQPLTQLQNNAHDITSLQNFGQEWMNLAKEITSTPDAIQGNTFPSGTAYRQVVALQQEAHSLFEIMTENKGLAIEEMMRRFIIPFLKKKMDTKEELAAILDERGIEMIDSMYVPNKAVERANIKAIEKGLKDKRAVNEDQFNEIRQQEEFNIKNELATGGNTRYLKVDSFGKKTWKEYLKGLEWDVEVEVTNETTDKEAVLATLTTVLQKIATNPMVLQDKNMKILFNKILTTTGEISPLELSAGEAPQNQPQLPVNPQQLGNLEKVGGKL